MTLYPYIQFVVLQDRALNPHLSAFLDSVAHWRPFTEAVPWSEIHTVRNRAFRWFLAKTDLPWLVMCDADTVWTDAAIPLLDTSADVASAAFARARDGQDGHPSTMSVGAIKLSRPAVRRIGECWIAPPGPGQCECPAFYKACIAAGFDPVKAGAVGHRVPVTLWPGKVFRLDSEVSVLSAGDAVEKVQDGPANQRKGCSCSNHNGVEFGICHVSPHEHIIGGTSEKVKVI